MSNNNNNFSVVMKHKRNVAGAHVFTVKARDIRGATTKRRANDMAIRQHPNARVLFVRDNATGRAIA